MVGAAVSQKVSMLAGDGPHGTQSSANEKREDGIAASNISQKSEADGLLDGDTLRDGQDSGASSNSNLSPITPALIAGGVLVAVIGLVTGAALSGALSAENVLLLAEWFETLGPSAVVLYAVMYFVLELVAVPALPLTLGSGYLFGVTTGTAVVSVASTAAAAAAFLIARYGLRDYISTYANRYPKFRVMDRAIGREGFKFVLLLRLSPLLPFAVSNYLYGLTSVQLPKYITASWLGMLPGTIAYVSAGAAVNALTDLSLHKSAVNPVLVGIGLISTVAALVTIGRIAGDAVKEIEREGEPRAP